MKAFFKSRDKISFLLGSLLGLVVAIGCIFLATRMVLSHLDYLPLSQVLKKAGYAPVSSQGEKRSYALSFPLIELTVDAGEETFQKGDFTFDASGQILKVFGQLYARKAFLEEVLDVRIRQEGGLSLEEVSASPLSWDTSMAPFIAHAGSGLMISDEQGTLSMQDYTNSLEAIVTAYESGYRVFEIDFHLTSDGQPVAVHNWEKQYGQVMSYEDYLGYSPWGITQLDVDGVMKLFAVNRDTLIVLDTKVLTTELLTQLYNSALAAGGEELVNRIIPQIYFPEDLQTVRSVYPWKVIYTLYRSKDEARETILSFIESEPDILCVTLPKKQAEKAFSNQIHALGRSVLVYTVDNLGSLYEFLNEGVDGFYTNTMPPEGWKSLYGERPSHLFPSAQ